MEVQKAAEAGRQLEEELETEDHTTIILYTTNMCCFKINFTSADLYIIEAMAPMSRGSLPSSSCWLTYMYMYVSWLCSKYQLTVDLSSFVFLCPHCLLKLYQDMPRNGTLQACSFVAKWIIYQLLSVLHSWKPCSTQFSSSLQCVRAETIWFTNICKIHKWHH